jgi:hypothetical protein
MSYDLKKRDKNPHLCLVKKIQSGTPTNYIKFAVSTSLRFRQFDISANIYVFSKSCISANLNFRIHKTVFPQFVSFENLTYVQSGWQDWANFRQLSYFYLLTYSQFWVNFFHRISYVIKCGKIYCLGYTLGYTKASGHTA